MWSFVSRPQAFPHSKTTAALSILPPRPAKSRKTRSVCISVPTSCFSINTHTADSSFSMTKNESVKSCDKEDLEGASIQPAFLTDCLSTGIFKESLSQEFCNRADIAVSNDSAVNIDNSDNFGSGSGQEELITGIKVIAGQIFFDHWDIFFPSKFHNQIASDTDQSASFDRRSVQRAFFDNENVISAGFGNITHVVIHNALRDVVIQSLYFRQNVVKIIEALDLWRNGQRVISHCNGADDFHPFFVKLFGVKLDFVSDN